jgi:hypothetical protein
MVTGVRSGLRHPQRLTVHAIASETFNTASDVLRAARAAQRRRPRIAAARGPVRSRIASPAPGRSG